MSNMAAPDVAAPAAEIAATAHVHDLEPAMAATLTPIRAILAAVRAYDGERVRVGGWVRTGRVQCGGTVAFLAVNDGSCHATLQLVVDAAQVPHPPLARLAATGTSVLVSGVLRIPTKRSKERIELGVDAVLHAGLVDDAAAYPLPKSRLRLDYLRDFLHFRPRTETVWQNYSTATKCLSSSIKFPLNLTTVLRFSHFADGRGCQDEEPAHICHTLIFPRKRLFVRAHTDCDHQRLRGRW
jgi:hypothetical protein